MDSSLTDQPYEHKLAVCPSCGARLKGEREPGDKAHCARGGRDVLLEPGNKNHLSHRPVNHDAPGAFGPDWATTRYGIKSRRDDSRVPVHITFIDHRNILAIQTP